LEIVGDSHLLKQTRSLKSVRERVGGERAGERGRERERSEPATRLRERVKGNVRSEVRYTTPQGKGDGKRRTKTSIHLLPLVKLRIDRILAADSVLSHRVLPVDGIVDLLTESGENVGIESGSKLQGWSRGKEISISLAILSDRELKERGKKKTRLLDHRSRMGSYQV